ncbi:tRNA pseudouridine(38-40) synthase TruA [candidate division WOR-3 bacterium]|nr:tRNA pseudouridine(38-40) synthase TruA [candidate division WOR-3 bacterium]
MRRIKILISYKGGNFYGWQYQKEKRTVQGELEKRIKFITGENIRVTAAGRTDAGVHALGQTAHFDTFSALPDKDFLKAINSVLPADLGLNDLTTAFDSFHSTKDATERQYLYRIDYSGANPFTRGIVWRLRKKLNHSDMSKALLLLKGKHDFSSFCIAKSSDKNTFVDMRSAEITETGSGIVLFFAADRFLHKMLRSVVGMLYDIGRGKRDPDCFSEALLLKNRKYGGFTAPPDGLYLYRVLYSNEKAPFILSEFIKAVTGF